MKVRGCVNEVVEPSVLSLAPSVTSLVWDGTLVGGVTSTLALGYAKIVMAILAGVPGRVCCRCETSVPTFGPRKTGGSCDLCRRSSDASSVGHRSVQFSVCQPLYYTYIDGLDRHVGKHLSYGIKSGSMGENAFSDSRCQGFTLRQQGPQKPRVCPLPRVAHTADQQAIFR